MEDSNNTNIEETSGGDWLLDMCLLSTAARATVTSNPEQNATSGKSVTKDLESTKEEIGKAIPRALSAGTAASRENQNNEGENKPRRPRNYKETGPQTCSICGKEFDFMRYLVQHQRDSHEGEGHCPGCGKFEWNRKSLEMHNRRCKKMTGVKQKCFVESCNDMFLRWEELDKHLTEMHPTYINIEFKQLPKEKGEKPQRKPKADKKKMSNKRLEAPHTAKRNVPTKKFKSSDPEAKKPIIEDDQLVFTDPNLYASGSYAPIPVLTPNIHRIPPRHLWEDKLRNYTFLEPADMVTQLPKPPGDDQPDSFRPCVEIRFSTMKNFRYFAPFVSFMYQNDLHLSGAVYVHPPPLFEAAIETEEKWKKIYARKANRIETIRIENTTPCGNAFLVDKTSVASRDGYTLRDYKTETIPGHPAYDSLEKLEESFFQLIPGQEMRYASNLEVKSLFEPFACGWNLQRLDCDFLVKKLIYSLKGKKEIAFEGKGIKTSWLYVGDWLTLFALHLEDLNLGSISYLHAGKPKVWFIVGPQYAHVVQEKMAQLFPEEHEKCKAFLRHKSVFLKPSLLTKWGIPYNKIVQVPGTFVVLAAGAYHFGYNLGFNISEAVNFSTFETFPYTKMNQYKCFCYKKMNYFPMENLVRFHQGAERAQRFLDGTDMDLVPHQEYLGLQPVLNNEQLKKEHLRLHGEFMEAQATDNNVESIGGRQTRSRTCAKAVVVDEQDEERKKNIQPKIVESKPTPQKSQNTCRREGLRNRK